jgi:hypothetical protein
MQKASVTNASFKGCERKQQEYLCILHHLPELQAPGFLALPFLVK